MSRRNAIAPYTARGVRRRRSRAAVAAAVVATASLLSAYAAAFRAVPTYAAAPTGQRRDGLLPRSLTCPSGSTQVVDDTELQDAVAVADDSTTICLTASIQLSATLELDDTTVTFVGGDPGVVLYAPVAGGRHIYADFDDTASFDTLFVESLTLTGGYVYGGGGGSIYLKGYDEDRLNLVDDTFTDNEAYGGGGAIFATAMDALYVGMASVYMSDDTAVAGGAVAVYSDSGLATVFVAGFDGAPSTFTRNVAHTYGPAGGAIFAGTNDGTAAVLVAGDVRFVDNVALNGDGGAIEVHAHQQTGSGPFDQSALALTLGTYEVFTGTPYFDGNESSGSGGAIHSNGIVLQSVFAGYGYGASGGVFHDNAALQGGAVAAPSVIAYRTSFLDNHAALSGGAIHLDDSSVLISGRSLFDGNIAGQNGGAISSLNGVGPDAQVALGNVTMTGNRATSGSGGAIYLDSALASLTNVTLSDNQAYADGGALWLGDDASINFATITGNSADDTGGGLFASGDLDVSNSIFWNNSADDEADVHAPSLWTPAYSLFADDTSFTAPTTPPVGVITGEDPLLGPLTDNGGVSVLGTILPTRVLSWLSPAKNAANPDTSDFPEFDERGAGYLRVFGPRADMGATELQVTMASVSPALGPRRGGTSVVILGSGFDGATGVAFGSRAAASFEVVDDSHIVAVTPAGLPGPVDVSVSADGASTSLTDAFTYTGTIPGPPVPPAPAPPGPPRDVVAAPGNAVATVSWQAPDSTGTSPITGYRVLASPGSGSCSTIELTCTVTGLTNGTTYTFTVEAANSEGSGPPSLPSNPVTPSAPPVEKSIIIVGSRDTTAPVPTVVVKGTTTGLIGESVVPFVRFPGKVNYEPGLARPTVDATGSFVWSRKTAKKTYVYFVAGDLVSNRVIVPPSDSPSRLAAVPDGPVPVIEELRSWGRPFAQWLRNILSQI